MSEKPEYVTLTTRVQAQGNGLGIYLTRAVAEAADVVVGDIVEVRFRKVRKP